jgi:hypothetical protein
MTRKYNSIGIIAIVVFITLVEGLVIYINIVLLPEQQPARTALIVVVATIANGIMAWYISRKTFRPCTKIVRSTLLSLSFALDYIFMNTFQTHYPLPLRTRFYA